jgi:Lon protease-like protein
VTPATDYPDHLGVFPLPRLVPFPHAHAPLHVFEPRYRELLRDALAKDGRFVLATLRSEDDAEQECHPCACAGRVMQHLALEDGRSELVWRGERVVTLVDVGAAAPYRTARLLVRPDDDAFAGQTGGAARLAELRLLLEQACPGALAALESRLVTPAEKDGGLELLHTLASTFPAAVDRKLEWLACRDSLERWLSIRAMLAALAMERTRKSRAITRYADLAPKHPQRT